MHALKSLLQCSISKAQAAPAGICYALPAVASATSLSSCCCAWGADARRCAMLCCVPMRLSQSPTTHRVPDEAHGGGQGNSLALKRKLHVGSEAMGTQGQHLKDGTSNPTQAQTLGARGPSTHNLSILTSCPR